MFTVTATSLLHNFSLYTIAAKKGEPVLATFHNRPWCLLARPSILTDDEAATSTKISATEAYHHLSAVSNACAVGKVFLIYSHGRARCAIVPPAFQTRLMPAERHLREPDWKTM